jgi:hypothetical protein
MRRLSINGAAFYRRRRRLLQVKKQLSLPSIGNAKVSPKHKAHGTSVEKLLPASVVESLGALKGATV